MNQLMLILPLGLNYTCFSELINKGVKEPLFDNENELNFKVHEDFTNISLSVSEVDKSYSPPPVIVKISSSIVYPSPLEENEIDVDDMIVINNERNIRKMILFELILFLYFKN